LFKPEWGVYDMVVGENIISAFSGIADPNSFGQQFEIPKEKTHKLSYSLEEKALFELYQQVRQMRKSKHIDGNTLQKIFGQLKENYPNDWLLVLEIYELIKPGQMTEFITEVKSYLEQFYHADSVKNLVQDGIRLIDESLN
jgi:phenylalanine-4-hydroxylase